MRTAKARKGQSLIDLALQECGSADCGEEVAKMNGLAADYVCSGGEELEMPDGSEEERKRIAAAGVVPVTGLDAGGWKQQGIGLCMVGEMSVR